MMTPAKYFDFIKTKMVSKFLETFGGSFSYSPEFAYTYEYGKKLYFLGGNDFEKDVKKSLETGENLLIKYEEVEW